MRQPHGVLVVFDSRPAQEEILRYAVELARRLRCSMSVLVLPGGAAGPADTCASDLGAMFQSEGRDGIEIDVQERCGDRASELLKFLASRPPYRALVWGGGRLAPVSRPFGGEKHWLGRIRSHVLCPIVVAKPRTPSASRRRQP